MADESARRAGQLLGARRRALAERMAAAPGHDAAGEAERRADAEHHLANLAEAMAAAQPPLFEEYVAWARTRLVGRGAPDEDLGRTLDAIAAALRDALPADAADVAARYLDAGRRRLATRPAPPPSFLDAAAPYGDLARAYLEALLDGARHEAGRLVLDAAAGGVPVRELYLHVLQPSQREIGRLWQVNQITVAQEHYCTAATQVVMSQLYPLVFATPRIGRTLVATCVAGDLHEIGARMIADFLEMEGWDTFYLGANAPTADVVSTVRDRRADLLAISATMTAYVGEVRALIAAVRSDVATAGVKILVGGSPFNVAPDLWRQVGADAVAADAASAVTAAADLVPRTA